MKEEEQKYNEFIASYILNRLEGEELKEFTEWLNSSPENRSILEQAKESWDLASLADPKTKFSTEEGWKNFKQKRKSADSVFIATNWLKVAASLLIPFILGALGYHFFNKSFANGSKVAEMFETVASNGSKTEMHLSDGTKVWLNAGTTLRQKPKRCVSRW